MQVLIWTEGYRVLSLVSQSAGNVEQYRKQASILRERTKANY